MTDLHDAAGLQSLYGPCYKFSDAKPGDTIRYRDAVQLRELEGIVLWVVGPGPIAGTEIPAHYIVETPGIDWPETVFPSDVIADRDTTLQKCPYCGGLHEVGNVEQCPRKQNKESEL